MGYGPDRNMRRHGPYDSSSNNPNMMQGPGQHSPPTRGWGPNANRNRRSASPDYSRGGSGGGGGGPPGRGFDDQNRYGQGPGQGPAHGGWGARVPPSRDNFGGGGGRGFNQYGGGPGGGGGGGGYDPAGGPSSRSGFQRMELGGESLSPSMLRFRVAPAVFPGALSPRCRLASSSEMLLQNAIWQHSGVFVLSVSDRHPTSHGRIARVRIRKRRRKKRPIPSDRTKEGRRGKRSGRGPTQRKASRRQHYKGSWRSEAVPWPASNEPDSARKRKGSARQRKGNSPPPAALAEACDDEPFEPLPASVTATPVRVGSAMTLSGKVVDLRTEAPRMLSDTDRCAKGGHREGETGRNDSSERSTSGFFHKSREERTHHHKLGEN
jgi:hypothetical protein